MTKFKKAALIAFIAQFGYFSLAALAFGKGQSLLHNFAAIVAGLFLTTRIVKHHQKLAWLSPLIWVVLALGCYQVIILWLKIIHWTAADIFPTNSWNFIRIFDLFLLSLIIAFAITKIWPRLKTHLNKINRKPVQ